MQNFKTIWQLRLVLWTRWIDLTHSGRVTHICVGNLTIIGSDDDLSPGRRHAITWTNVGILLIGPLGTHISEMLIEIHTFSFKKIHLKMLSGKWRPFCLGLSVLSYTVASPREWKLYGYRLYNVCVYHSRDNGYRLGAASRAIELYIFTNLSIISYYAVMGIGKCDMAWTTSVIDIRSYIII